MHALLKYTLSLFPQNINLAATGILKRFTHYLVTLYQPLVLFSAHCTANRKELYQEVIVCGSTSVKSWLFTYPRRTNCFTETTHQCVNPWAAIKGLLVSAFQTATSILRFRLCSNIETAGNTTFGFVVFQHTWKVIMVIISVVWENLFVDSGVLCCNDLRSSASRCSLYSVPKLSNYQQYHALLIF